MIMNPGNFDKKITLCYKVFFYSNAGFAVEADVPFYDCFANIKTLKGITLIKNGSDFEKALINFTIRFPKVTFTTKNAIFYKGKIYSIEYLNNVDGENLLLEIQAKEVGNG